jgi:hypothetical protein
MENRELNIPESVTRDSVSRKSLTSARFSLSSAGRRSSIRRSLRRELVGDTPLSPDSGDDDWLNIQRGVSAAARLRAEIDTEVSALVADDDADGCRRAITFTSPDTRKLSLGAINTQREEVSLLRQSMELDEEAQYIEDYRAAMEGHFAVMFAEVTKRRLNAKRAEKKEFDVYELIDSLNLPDFPYTQWAERIESAIITAME